MTTPSHRNPNHAFSALLFLACLLALLGLTIDAAYDFGHRHGVASVKPALCPHPMSYDMPRKQLLRRIKYEQSKGGVK